MDPQGFSVSKFGQSTFSGGKNTLIFAATVRGSDRRAIGGVAVVFDACAQLTAMLADSLPHDEHGKLRSGVIGVLLDRDGNIMCATDESLDPEGDVVESIRKSLTSHGAQVKRIGGQYYAIGTRLDTGYREYTGLGRSRCCAAAARRRS